MREKVTELHEIDAGDQSQFENVNATTRPFPPTRFCRFGPAAGVIEVDDTRAILSSDTVVDLDELVGGARAQAFALGARDVRIVELALEPQLRRHRAGLAGADLHLQRTLLRSAVIRMGRVLPALAVAIPHAVLAHHLHQHTCRLRGFSPSRPPSTCARALPAAVWDRAWASGAPALPARAARCHASVLAGGRSGAAQER